MTKVITVLIYFIFFTTESKAVKNTKKYSSMTYDDL